jgi:hypothetical protein
MAAPYSKLAEQSAPLSGGAAWVARVCHIGLSLYRGTIKLSTPSNVKSVYIFRRSSRPSQATKGRRPSQRLLWCWPCLPRSGWCKDRWSRRGSVSSWDGRSGTASWVMRWACLVRGMKRPMQKKSATRGEPLERGSERPNSSSTRSRNTCCNTRLRRFLTGAQLARTAALPSKPKATIPKRIKSRLLFWLFHRLCNP